VAWHGVGAGWGLAGETVVSVRGVPVDAPPQQRWLSKPPSVVVAAAMHPRALTAELLRLSSDGRGAVWETISGLEAYTLRAAWAAHSAVFAEMAGGSASAMHLLDGVETQEVCDRLLLGSEGEGPSAVARLVERCLSPVAFRGADPLKVVRMSLRRDAEAEIRRRVGDPHIGSKIRGVARDLGLGAVVGRIDPDVIAEVVARYSLRWPKDRLAAERARRAIELIGGTPGPPVPVPHPGSTAPGSRGRW